MNMITVYEQTQGWQVTQVESHFCSHSHKCANTHNAHLQQIPPHTHTATYTLHTHSYTDTHTHTHTYSHARAPWPQCGGLSESLTA